MLFAELGFSELPKEGARNCLYHPGSTTPLGVTWLLGSIAV